MHNICGCLIQTAPALAPAAWVAIAATAGCEVHAEDRGRLVVTVEDTPERRAADIIMDLHQIPGVLGVTLPEPFLSRCQIVEVHDITPAQLHDFAVRRGLEMKLSQEALEAVCEVLVMAPRMTGRRMSLRDVVRMLERAETLEGRPRLQ